MRAGAAGIAYLLAGLAVLRRMLRRHFSDGVVLATLVAITWGTNLFHYARVRRHVQPRLRFFSRLLLDA